METHSSEDLTVAILAGGSSSRFGRCKALETINGISLLESLIHLFSELTLPPLIITSREEYQHIAHLCSNQTLVQDILPGKGSIGGIYTALASATTQYTLIVGCDMPFLNKRLIEYIALQRSGYDAVVPRIGELVQPLHSIYSKKCIPSLEKLLDSNILRIKELFSFVNVRYITEDEIDYIDPNHRSFVNINSQEDLNKAIDNRG
jgi:molybdenum cofactor guanylyltransferase